MNTYLAPALHDGSYKELFNKEASGGNERVCHDVRFEKTRYSQEPGN